MFSIMFTADIQPPCASPLHAPSSSSPPKYQDSRSPGAAVFSIKEHAEGRTGPPGLYFSGQAAFFSPGTSPGFIFPPPVSLKLLGKNIHIFPQCPKITRKSRDLTGSLLWIGHISLFSLCMSKNCWNFGHNRKKPPSMPKNKAGGVLKCFL